MATSKRKFLVRIQGIVLFKICMVIGITLNAQELPDKEDILDKITLANKYFMDKWPDVGKRIVTTAPGQAISGQEEYIMRV